MQAFRIGVGIYILTDLPSSQFNGNFYTATAFGCNFWSSGYIKLSMCYVVNNA